MSWTEDAGSAVGGAVGGVLSAVEQATQAGFSAAALAQAQQAAQGLKNAASSGQIRITDNGFKILTDALNQCEDHLLELKGNLNFITEAPRLGSSPYAETVAEHVQKSATGLPNSADSVFQQFAEVLNTTRDALNQARKSYQDNEHGNVRVLK